LNEWVYLSAFGELYIGDGTSIGHRTSILTSDHSIKSGTMIKEQPLKSEPTTIGNDVFLGANCTVLMKVSVGNGGVIGAGSVVTKSVDENQIVAGNPAKPLGNRI
jgi:acetyltransferase-like isoleucine patch superfamily enzyme